MTEVSLLIRVTRIKGGVFVINEDHIEMMESNPDTVITLVNGHRYVVAESAEEILARIQLFRHS